ncbi:unnamed protein product [Peronospora belbahrii]|uniref:F-box domain-containing protein n=1 Tax=Peronospora belbahrii TaxID=622444 RepID=A0ABN8CSZ6_9STRA|nr:unnamed protein product [Peronospora belbahrii]
MAIISSMDVSVEVLQILERLLDVKMLMLLSMTCRPLLETLKALIEQRCKRECLTTYLYPTVASYRMQVAVPATWRQLYVAFNSLKDLCWQACRGDMTSSSLRALKSDNYAYESDITGTFLIRSGGHYWFSVLQAKPRRCDDSHVYNGVKSDEKNEEEMHVNVRRIIFFGGQSEGIPFEAFGDLHLLCIQQVAASSLNTPRAVWVQTNVTVQAPPPRCGHAATLLSSDLILITGGSMGVSPI